MLGGVAFFSFIMGEFMELVEKYYSKMINLPDKKEELTMWVQALSRFNKNLPITKPHPDQLDKDFAYFWANDKKAFFMPNDENRSIALVPESIKIDLLISYVYVDLIKTNYFLGNQTIAKDREFLYYLCNGLNPRRFGILDKDD